MLRNLTASMVLFATLAFPGVGGAVLPYGHLLARPVSWAVDSVSAAPVAGDVHITTVPAVAGVRLTVAGAPVTTGAGGLAIVAVADLDGLTTKVRLASSTVGTDTVSITKVVRNPSLQGSRSLTVGLNVTARVRLSMVARTSAVSPDSVRSIRLHSSNGRVVVVNPHADRAVPLLAQRTTMQHGRLVARNIAWTVDSVSAAPGVAVTATRTPFEPSMGSTWVVELRPAAGTVRVETTPAVVGAHLIVAGVPAITGPGGVATVSVSDLNDIAKTVRLASPKAGRDIVAIHRVDKVVSHSAHKRAIVVALKVARAVTLTFSDPNGKPVALNRVNSVTLRGDGSSIVLRGAALRAPVILASKVPSLVHGRWLVHAVTYSADDVRLDGGNAVFAGRQRFEPASAGAWHISLALYTATIRVTDAFFGGSIASAAELTAPNNVPIAINIPRGGATLPSAVRGMYTLKVDNAVLGGTSRILVSRDVSADIRVVTSGDIAIIAAGIVALAVALILLGALIERRNPTGPPGMTGPPPVLSHRPRRRRLWAPRWHGRRASMFTLIIVGGVVFSILTFAPSSMATTPSPTPTAGAMTLPVPTPSAARAPVYIYFYQWFTASSWRRAKMDTPLIGNYSSADPTVLRTQLTEIKAAGINGILTSWKNDAQLNSNLQMLIDQAGSENLELGVVYEALDFARKPLPITTVRSDMLYLVNRWGSSLDSPSFGLPIIIWTGTNEYTPAQVQSVHEALAGKALLLAASKNVPDYDAVASSVDGDAYYWSSSNPAASITAGKLAAMGKAVRAHGGIWIAPAAAGFDGRPLGHNRVVARNDGQALELSLRDAYASDPTAVGVISWNEWSENTYIEPGKRYGSTELTVLTTYLRGIRADGNLVAPASPTVAGVAAPHPVLTPASSGARAGTAALRPTQRGRDWILVTIIAVVIITVVVLGVVTRRRSRRRRGTGVRSG